MAENDFDIYKLGDWHLHNGATLPDAHLAYKTFGEPNLPAIVYPTWFSGGTAAEDALEGKQLNAEQLYRTMSG